MNKKTMSRRDFLKGMVKTAAAAALANVVKFVPEAQGVFAQGGEDKLITKWQRYDDAEHKIALEYPDEWKTKTTIQQKRPFSDSESIIKRQTFIGPEGFIDLDIWLLNNRDFEAWLAWYGETRSRLPVVSPNAKISRKPAIVFIETGATVNMLATFFSDGEYVYRLWYMMIGNTTGLQVYRHMLDSAEISGLQASAAELPESVKQDAQIATGISPLTSGCCAYYQYYNPFPCCDNQGNCTWWVYYKYGYVPFRGDAGTWWGQVPDYSYDWGRGGLPRRNPGENIAWWSGNPGHVAYVANYVGGNNIDISEMLWCTNCGRTRQISVSDPGGYIYYKLY